MKTIEIEISKLNIQGEWDVIHTSTTKTGRHPQDYIGEVMVSVGEVVLEDDDNEFLNYIGQIGFCGFKFGPNWEFYVKAKIVS